ncbi:hypothetical protein [Dyadobacter sandarakinus]|uniref:Dolichyl-phosphate-mannose-protein mannosyltransferase n=1 Tax=Dyadobacter sandarakinus TaxID=2747268 RepID=A0ABX7I161_9BACT|nr:hypothetical protein [Dyadobacter sandarakinus]QRQ99800.1 hypothetical protein HWI92_02130 [Dyadobacter sandarakinus]
MIDMLMILLPFILMVLSLTALAYDLGKHTREISVLISFTICIALCSCSFYTSMFFQSTNHEVIIPAILIILSSIILILLRSRVAGGEKIENKKALTHHLIVVIVSLLATIRLIKFSHHWGDWDAWAIWNVHGKFLAYSEHWTNMFSPHLASSHPDYPLMLPTLLALGFKSFGVESAIVPLILACVIFCGIIAATYYHLTQTRGFIVGIGAVTILLLDKDFVRIAASQYSDTLLAFFILVSLILYQQRSFSGRLNYILLGFLVGSCVWIKNEGQLYFLIFTLFFILYERKWIGTKWYFVGALVPIAVLVHFKLYLAPSNDIFNHNRDLSVFHLVTDVQRYIIISKTMILTLLKYYWVILLLSAICIFTRKQILNNFSLLVLTALLLGYCAVYLITPNDLQWHLNQSIDRLIHHVYPSLLVVLLSTLTADVPIEVENLFQRKSRIAGS